MSTPKIDRDALIEAAARALIDSETNGLCGSSWPGPCDMCDCGLEGVSPAVAAEGASAQRDRERIGHVLSKVLPMIADAIEAELRDTVSPGDPSWCQGYGVGMGAAAELVRSLDGAS